MNSPKAPARLYKFRSLDDCESSERTERIIETSEFWCSRYWDLNDQLEGIFLVDGSLGEHVSGMFEAKQAIVTCSFSGAAALADPRMWAHYAGGFKGLAIEIDVSRCISQIRPIQYERCIVDQSDSLRSSAVRQYQQSAERVLQLKLQCWEYESEYRYLKWGSNPGLKEIGRVTRVFFCDPYSQTVNGKAVQQASSRIQAFLRRRKRLEELAKTERLDVVHGEVCKCGSIVFPGVIGECDGGICARHD